MFLPPSGDIPSNQEDVSVPLKTILMWNGLSSWGKVRPGRGEFIKQECPVSTCAIVTDRSQAEHSDMVLFKDHFSLPQFKRPSSQIWMIFMLGKSFSFCSNHSDFEHAPSWPPPRSHLSLLPSNCQPPLPIHYSSMVSLFFLSNSPLLGLLPVPIFLLY